jgi:hypothetical protein
MEGVQLRQASGDYKIQFVQKDNNINTHLHNSTNSCSSIVPDPSTSKHSKQNRMISSFVNMQ